ncbi:hypothetical protein GQ607_001464 [Colletotrichum asianum]|uniref:Uncharacterized protein n=1 Tax=Colletotrichum asianum TaxID=702518 RepID=A0A8H3WM68_9PEZI|nr:hypothetical protein GQ607_001464 [Colletotrichum asianum]
MAAATLPRNGSIVFIARVVKNSEAFHDLIGFRYSPGRVDVCPIAMADMPPNQRFLDCEVALEYNPNIGTPIRNARDEFAYHVKLPYQSTQPPVQVFRPATAAQGNSARGRAGGSRR